MDVIASISNDFAVFDGLEPVNIRSSTSNGGVVDFDLQKSVHLYTEYPTVALFRQNSNRNAGSVRNLRERENALQIEFFNKSDYVVEIPACLPEGVKIKQGDTLTRMCDGSKWIINGTDVSTLRTRIRLGVSKFV